MLAISCLIRATTIQVARDAIAHTLDRGAMYGCFLEEPEKDALRVEYGRLNDLLPEDMKTDIEEVYTGSNRPPSWGPYKGKLKNP